MGELGIPNSNRSSEVEYLFDENKVLAGSYRWDENGELVYTAFERDVPMWPAYEITLWLLDFGLAMRHFQGTEQDEFRVTMMGGTHTWQSRIFFDGEEEVNGVMCDKWVVQGRGILASLMGVKQEIWFSQESPYYHVVQYRNHRMGGRWPQQQYVLQDITEMTAEEWERHQAELTAQAREAFGY